MLNSILSGVGFCAGFLICYTIYDIIFTAIEKKRERAAFKKAQKQKRRHK